MIRSPVEPPGWCENPFLEIQCISSWPSNSISRHLLWREPTIGRKQHASRALLQCLSGVVIGLVKAAELFGEVRRVTRERNKVPFHQGEICHRHRHFPEGIKASSRGVGVSHRKCCGECG